MENNDKALGQMYDGLTGSRYINVIIFELMNEILVEKDLESLSEDVRNYLIVRGTSLAELYK